MSEWIKNTGVQPVSNSTDVEVKFFNGETTSGISAFMWVWILANESGHEIEYWRKAN